MATTAVIKLKPGLKHIGGWCQYISGPCPRSQNQSYSLLVCYSDVLYQRVVILGEGGQGRGGRDTGGSGVLCWLNSRKLSSTVALYSSCPPSPCWRRLIRSLSAPLSSFQVETAPYCPNSLSHDKAEASRRKSSDCFSEIDACSCVGSFRHDQLLMPVCHQMALRRIKSDTVLSAQETLAALLTAPLSVVSPAPCTCPLLFGLPVAL